MADYNIYIHAIGSAGATNVNPTLPWSTREESGGFESPTTSQSGGSFGGGGALNTFMRVGRYAQNPDSIVSQAVVALSRAAPWIAAAALVVSIGAKITENVIEFSEIESGDYKPGIEWNNLKTSFHNILTPVSSTLNSFKTQAQWNKENKRRRAHIELLGDSVINGYSDRGV